MKFNHILIIEINFHKGSHNKCSSQWCFQPFVQWALQWSSPTNPWLSSNLSNIPFQPNNQHNQANPQPKSPDKADANNKPVKTTFPSSTTTATQSVKSTSDQTVKAGSVHTICRKSLVWHKHNSTLKSCTRHTTTILVILPWSLTKLWINWSWDLSK